MTTLKATSRNDKMNGRQLRRVGLTPAIVYGKNLDASISIQLETPLATRMLKSNAIGAQIELTIDDEKYNTMLKEVTMHPINYTLEHMDFQVLTAGEKVSVTARINILNKDIVPQDAVLQELVSELTYSALPKDLIDHIDIDLTGLEIGSAIKLGDLDMAKDERYTFQDDSEMELVHMSHVKIVVEPTEEDEDAADPSGAEVPVIGKEEEE